MMKILIKYFKYFFMNEPLPIYKVEFNLIQSKKGNIAPGTAEVYFSSYEEANKFYLETKEKQRDARIIHLDLYRKL